MLMMKRISDTQGGPGRFRKGALCRSQRRVPVLGIRNCAIALNIAALCLVFGATSLTAKKKGPPTSKTVVGQVFDGQDNAIAGAAVEITDLTTNKTSAIYTGPEGRFTFTDLKLTQDYQLKAHYKGQFSEVRKVSSWDTRTDLVLNLHIPPPSE